MKNRRFFVWVLLAVILSVGVSGKNTAAAGVSDSSEWDQVDHKPLIKSGFDSLYGLNFEEARKKFLDWEKMHPEDPLGDAWGNLSNELPSGISSPQQNLRCKWICATFASI